MCLSYQANAEKIDINTPRRIVVFHFSNAFGKPECLKPLGAGHRIIGRQLRLKTLVCILAR